MKSTPTINEKLSEAIDQEAPAERIITALANALEADVAAKDGTRAPDHRTRVAAAQLLLNYRIGRPNERPPVKEPETGQQSESLEEKLKRSPALREMYQRMIDEAVEAARE